MLKLKEILLSRGFIDNESLDEYVELVINSYTVPVKKGSTQKHHVIPVSCYNTTISDSAEQRATLLRLANNDPDNYKVNLSYSDHIKAHLLLCQCSPNIIQKIHNTTAYTLMLSTLLPAVAAGIVSDLETPEEQQLAYEYVRANTAKSSGGFKLKTKRVDKTTGTTRRKVRCIETGEVFASLKDAEAAKGLTKGRLNTILAGYRKQIPGMTFEYYDDPAEI